MSLRERKSHWFRREARESGCGTWAIGLGGMGLEHLGIDLVKSPSQFLSLFLSGPAAIPWFGWLFNHSSFLSSSKHVQPLFLYSWFLLASVSHSFLHFGRIFFLLIISLLLFFFPSWQPVASFFYSLLLSNFFSFLICPALFSISFPCDSFFLYFLTWQQQWCGHGRAWQNWAVGWVCRIFVAAARWQQGLGRRRQGAAAKVAGFVDWASSSSSSLYFIFVFGFFMAWAGEKSMAEDTPTAASRLGGVGVIRWVGWIDFGWWIW